MPRAKSKLDESLVLNYLRAYKENSTAPHPAPFSSFPPLPIEEPYLAFPASLKPADRELLHTSCLLIDLPHGSTGVKPNRQFVCSRTNEFGPFNISTNSSYENDQIKFFELTPHAFDPKGPVGEMEENLERVRMLFVKDMIRESDRSFTKLKYNNLGDCADVDVEKIDLVDSLERFDAMVQHLNGGSVTIFAFDLEMANLALYASCSITCLLQITTNDGKDYVIDTLVLEVWLNMWKLRKVFADSKVVKVGHAIKGMDVPALSRDFGIIVVNAFDTSICGKALGLAGVCGLGLANLCAYYGLKESENYIELKSKYQNCDWTMRPLTTSMLTYGCYDTHFLIALRDLMIRDVLLGVQAGTAVIGDATIVADPDRMVLSPDRIDLSPDRMERSQTIFFDSSPVADENDSADPLNESLNESGYLTPDEVDDNLMLSDENDDDLESNQRLMQIYRSCNSACQHIFNKNKKKQGESGAKALKSMKSRKPLGGWGARNESAFLRMFLWRDLVSDKIKCLKSAVFDLIFLVDLCTIMPDSVDELLRSKIRIPLILKEGEYMAEAIRVLNDEIFSPPPSQPSDLEFKNVTTRKKDKKPSSKKEKKKSAKENLEETIRTIHTEERDYMKHIRGGSGSINWVVSGGVVALLVGIGLTVLTRSSRKR